MSYIGRALAAPLMLALAAGCATAPGPVPLADAAPGQRAWATTCEGKDGWDEPGPPFRIHGNAYYVGTCGITAVLLTSASGHTLIDTGTDAGARVVLANIAALGFDPADVTTILLSHEHYDHVGGMARVQAATGATIRASAPAAAVLRSGRPGPQDPQAQSGHPDFPSVTGSLAILDPSQPLRIGGRTIQPIATPGHTPGAVSYSWRECQGGDCKDMVYVDSLNPISADGFRFSDRPQLLAGFRAGVARIAAAPCDIVIAPHPGAVALRERLLGTRPLVDQAGCRAFAASVTERLDKRLAQETANGG